MDINSSLVRADPVEKSVKGWILLQPVFRFHVFDSQVVDYSFVGDGGEFLLAD